MKPRTKLQVEVMRLSKELHYRENELLPWASKECLEHKGYATKSRVVCMDCGGKFSPELVSRKRAVCPHCKTKIKVEQSRKTTDKQSVYFAIAEIIGEFQVIRNFELTAHYKAGVTAQYSCWEILQHWVRSDGKKEVVARNHTVNWYCDSWNGDMEIRKDYPRYYRQGEKYDIYPYKYHPDSEFKDIYRMYGINENLQGLTFIEAIGLLPKNTKAETLLKAKQYSLLGSNSEYNNRIERYWASIKICIRNKYKIEDASIWFDYLDLLRYFGKDLHNAHYVCPKNLKKEHDRLVKKKRKKQEQEESEQKKRKAVEDEKKFRELKAKFFGIEFTDGEINIKVLSNVQDYVKEGDTLHHCVFTNNYHLKADSLILSARIKEKPIETVEVSLKTMKVVQSRGLRNSVTEYHDRIVRLVNKNSRLIKKRIVAT